MLEESEGDLFNAADPSVPTRNILRSRPGPFPQSSPTPNYMQFSLRRPCFLAFWYFVLGSFYPTSNKPDRSTMRPDCVLAWSEIRAHCVRQMDEQT